MQLSKSEINTMCEIYASIINESPVIIYPFTTQLRVYDDRGLNHLQTIKLYNEFKPIDKFEQFDVFSDENEILFTDTELTYAKFSGTIEEDGGIKFTSAWQTKDSLGLARHIVFNYFLVKYAYIESDKYHTPLGKRYWTSIIDEAIKNKYKIELISTIEPTINITDIETANLYWNSDIHFAKYTFRVYRK